MRELESFSYSISHDLRAPLRHIAGYTRLLADDPTVRAQAETTELATRAAAAATRLGTLIDELLEYSRLARKPIALADVALGPLVASIIEELRAQRGSRTVRWTVGELPALRGDPTLVRLVVQNVLDNALKYTRRRAAAEIRVSASARDGRVTLRVADNGIGFDMAYAGKLFGVFQRLHTDVEFEGTGIGLAHVKRIIERHSGTLGAEAMPGAGATFWFELEAA